MTADLSNSSAQLADLRDRLRILQNVKQAGTGDSNHPGTGAYSILLDAGGSGIGEASADYTTAVGTDAKATTQNSSAFGFGAEATGTLSATAVGFNALASGDRSVSIGDRSQATGAPSVAIGSITKALADYGTVIGDESVANAANATVIGAFSTANHDTSTAVGAGVDTTASHQIMLGTSSETVVVPGTFSNPSARKLKRNIIPAPDLRDLFPELVEYEYIDGDGRRRLGFIADDLAGTGAERFVVFDDDGEPSGIDYLTLLVAQNAQLHARLTALENRD